MWRLVPFVCALTTGCFDRPLYVPERLPAVAVDLATADRTAPDLGLADLGLPDLGATDLRAPDLRAVDLRAADLETPVDLRTPPDLAPRGVVSVSAGGYHTCAVVHGGHLKCWGDNSEGQCGVTPASAVLTPSEVSLPSPAVAVSAGDYHTCAVDSTGGVVCWGDDTYGQLGDGSSNSSKPSPVPVIGLSSGVAAVSAGGAHSCAVTVAGALKCWGSNGHGQLGNNSTTDSATPVDVPGFSSGVVTVSAGAEHTCAITTGGALFCWGDNDWGKLGDGTIAERHAPVAVSGLSSGVVAVDAADVRTCAVLSSGAMKCWGYTAQGSYLTAPADALDDAGDQIADAVGLGLGTAHICWLTTSGAVYCVGTDLYLGNGGHRGGPTLSGAVSLSSTGGASCSVMSDGTIECWGDNTDAQLGAGWLSPPIVSCVASQCFSTDTVEVEGL